MESKTVNLKEEVDILEENISDEKHFSSSHPETILENGASTSQYYFETDNNITIREFDVMPSGLPIVGKVFSFNHERNYAKVGGNNFKMEHKINIKEEVDTSGYPYGREMHSTDLKRNSGNGTTIITAGFETAPRINIKQEINTLETDVQNGRDHFSANFGNSLNDTITCATHFTLESSAKSKELNTDSDIGFKIEEQCFYSDLENKIKKELIMHNENDGAGFERLSTETDYQSEAAAQKNENKVRDTKDSESAETSSISLQRGYSDTTAEKTTGTSEIGEATYLVTSKMLEDSKKCNTNVECNVFKKRFTPLSTLNTRSLIHENEKPHECSDCKKRFTQLSSLNAHILIHQGKKPHECNICKKRFTRLSNLNTHSLIHEGRKPHECNVCKKRFTQLSNLNTHSLIHAGEKPYECSICNKRFTWLSSLSTHSLTHEGRRPHECNICKKRFTQISNLNTHSLIHEGRKPHECNVCKKRFTQLSNLNKHSLIHEGKRPFECNVCMKRFTWKSHLNAHTLIHEGKKPYECNVCKKRFTQLSNLNTHSLIHEVKKPHECNVCKKRFTRISTLNRHHLIHEDKKPHECNICKRRFTQLSSLNTHSFIHGGIKPHECNVCKKRFTRISRLNIHHLIHEG